VSPAADAAVGDAARLLRSGLLVIAALTIAGTTLELAFSRHWGDPIRLLPWVALGALAVPTAVLAVRPSPTAIRLARGVTALVLAASLFGVVRHVVANYDAGPLDARYETRWATLSALERWWTAATGGVGPSPPLAPAAMASAALCVLVATLRHPAADTDSSSSLNPADMRAS